MTIPKTASLRPEDIDLMDVFLQIDPFVSKSLFDVLRYVGFKIDPDLSKVYSLYPSFFMYGYRIHSKKLGKLGPRLDYVPIYHEGIHNLVALRFGAKLRGRPRITLLNECLGVGLVPYLSGKLLKHTDIKPDDINLVIQMKNVAKQNGESVKETLRLAKKDPFTIYRKTCLEAWEIHRDFFEFTQYAPAHPEKWVKKLNSTIKNSKLHAMGESHLTIPGLFIAKHCGLVSSREDRKLTEECLTLLNEAVSMEDFLVKLGINEILTRGRFYA